MKCSEVKDFLDEYTTRELAEVEMLSIRQHLENCVACRQEANWHRQLAGAINETSPVSSEEEILTRVWNNIQKATIVDKAAPQEGSLMTPEEFRRYGHAVVDWIADYRERLHELPVMAKAAPGDIKSQLPATPPEAAENFDAILADYANQF